MSEQEVINCSHCSAPIDFRPGDAVAYCVYCDGTTKLREIKEEEKKYMLEPQFKREAVRKLLVGDVMKLPGVTEKAIKNLQIINAKLVFLPYYVVRTHGNTKWAGMGRQARFSSPYKGAYRHISFYTEPESGVFDDHAIITVYAGTEEYDFLKDYKLSSNGKKYFNLGEIKGYAGDAIDELFDNAQAEERAIGRLRLKHTNLLNEELQSITERNEEFNVDDWQLVFVPFWLLDWKYSGDSDSHKAIIDASSGQTVEMDTPRPKLYWIFAISTTILMLLIGIAPFFIFSSLGLPANPIIGITALIGVVYTIQTLYLIWPRKFVEDIN